MKKDPQSERALGMDRPITRRDFLNGSPSERRPSRERPCSPTASANLPTSPAGSADAVSTAAQDAPGYYPPLLTGMRGSHPGSFEAAHALRDGEDRPAGHAIPANEYDLIVVGGGISGLAAAHFYRAARGRDARILILDNHDDFGGHAKRNEFHLDGRLHLLNGGTLEIDSPRPYGAVADGLIRRSASIRRLSKPLQHRAVYPVWACRQGGLFRQRDLRGDRLVAGRRRLRAPTDRRWRSLVSQTPLSDRARREIVQIETAQIDYMAGISSAEKKRACRA